MTILNTTNYSDARILECDDFYTEQATTMHDGYVKSDEQIIREIEQAVLKGCGFIISEADCDRLLPRRD